MTRDIKLSLEASDVFELNRWLEALKNEERSFDRFNRRNDEQRELEHRIALLDKFVNAIKE